MDCPLIDISYCQRESAGPATAASRRSKEAQALGADRDGRYPWLYDSTRFFEQGAAWKRVRGIRGSMV